jgi:GrpB-like predicted nucleotidyltransferase (UPF0157 family)
MSLLTATGTYDLSAIMRKAQALASHHFKRDPHISRARHLSRWLKDVWAEARRAYDRHLARNGGNAAFQIIFDAVQATFQGRLPSPSGMAVTSSRSLIAAE